MAFEVYQLHVAWGSRMFISLDIPQMKVPPAAFASGVVAANDPRPSAKAAANVVAFVKSRIRFNVLSHDLKAAAGRIVCSPRRSMPSATIERATDGPAGVHGRLPLK